MEFHRLLPAEGIGEQLPQNITSMRGQGPSTATEQSSFPAQDLKCGDRQPSTTFCNCEGLQFVSLLHTSTTFDKILLYYHQHWQQAVCPATSPGLGLKFEF